MDENGLPIGEEPTWIPTTSAAFANSPGGSQFVGFVFDRAIGGMIIDETDDDPIFLDANVGYDSFRVSLADAP